MPNGQWKLGKKSSFVHLSKIFESECRVNQKKVNEISTTLDLW